MRVDPWPRVEIGGRLENAEREWLFTNGAGAYSMSTLALMHTRRYHGLLVAALKPPFDRHVILSHLETIITTASRVYRLSTHQFPNTAPTPGYRFLRQFAQDPLPRWRYDLGEGQLERVICLVRGQNVLIIAYTWRGTSRVKLSSRPLMPLRPLHQLTHEHGGISHDVTLRPGQVRIRPVADLPPVVFSQPGVFVGTPDWWRRFEYAEDRKRGAQHQEDMWTPGTFEMELVPDETSYLVVAVGELPAESPDVVFEKMRQYWLALDPGTRHSLVTRSLCAAAEHFRLDACDRPNIMAGYPWLPTATRDTLIAISGLYLAQGHYSEAGRVLESIVGLLHDGLLARGVREDGSSYLEPCADATLWLFEVTRQLVQALGALHPLITDTLYPALKRIFLRVAEGPREVVWLTDEGLVASSLDDVPLTWMDSRSQGQLVTPRQGAPIELQALWARGTQTLSDLSRELGDAELAEQAKRCADRTRTAFRARFWCAATSYPFDFLPVDGVGSTDLDMVDAIRPNALLALSLAPGLFERWQSTAIVKEARERLLTPRGLRTLDPTHSRYIGHYEGPMAARRAAYHQGVVWIYLLGAFARSSLSLEPNDFELQMELKHMVEQASQAGQLVGQVPQVASGDAPHQFGGSPAQAWSVSELLRTLVVDLNL